MSTTTHAIVAIENVLATEPGSISGFAAVCACGTRIESSLITCARAWGNDHVTYYTAKEAGR